jgi:ABC-2 type transport system permease protein
MSANASSLPFTRLSRQSDERNTAFNRAIWTRAVTECWLLLASLCILLFAFAWVYVWLISMIDLPVLYEFMLRGLKDLERLSGVPFVDVATPEGRIALAFVDPLVHLGVTVWAIARGSDAVAGELERGTMEMLLAQPVSRISVYVSKAVVTLVGLVLICVALWCGMAVGVLLIVEETDRVWPALYIAPTFNVFGLGVAMAGITAFVSSWDRYRWRTIGIMGAFYAIAVVLKVIGRMAPGWEPVGWFSVFWPFEPQRMVAASEDAWRLVVDYNAPLVAIGLVAYVAGAIIFCRRDLPAPL